jgi:5'-phosphate synthase pdxT subunit
MQHKSVGVLALQGDFEAHARTLERAGARPVLVRTRSDLDGVDGLVLPGGESSTMLNLLDREGLTGSLREFAAHKPLFGTCAGLILMAKTVTNPEQESLGVLDITVERNGYGRQKDSRVVKLEGIPDFEDMEAVFIRAPIVRSMGRNVRVLATYGGDPVLLEQGHHLASSFHPELSGETRIHELFLARL